MQSMTMIFKIAWNASIITRKTFSNREAVINNQNTTATDHHKITHLHMAQVQWNNVLHLNPHPHPANKKQKRKSIHNKSTSNYFIWKLIRLIHKGTVFSFCIYEMKAQSCQQCLCVFILKWWSRESVKQNYASSGTVAQAQAVCETWTLWYAEQNKLGLNEHPVSHLMSVSFIVYLREMNVNV